MKSSLNWKVTQFLVVDGDGDGIDVGDVVGFNDSIGIDVGIGTDNNALVANIQFSL